MGYEIAPSIRIAAPPETVWDLLVDIEAWWVASNPEHESLEILTNTGTIGEGTRIEVRERIAGIPGVARGEITDFVPERRIVWEAPKARYRYFGFPLTVSEGVAWEISPQDDGRTELTARVWASFPDTLWGRVIEWSFNYVVDGVERDYEHAMRELEYLKRAVEG